MDQLLCQQRPHVHSTCRSWAYGLGSAPGWLIPPPLEERGCQPGAIPSFSPSFLLETRSFFSAVDTASHHLIVQASQINLTRSIPGECNLYRGQSPSPIQGSFDLRPLGHYLFISFIFFWDRLGPGKIPYLGFQRPNQGMPPASHDEVDPRWRHGAVPVRGTPKGPCSHPPLPAAPAQPTPPPEGLQHRGERPASSP